MNIFSKNKQTLYSPMKGVTLPLSEVPDETFSGEVLGKGVAILPSEGRVYSPCDGVVDSVLPHAVNIIGKTGIEILIHVGLETVSLGGKGFSVHVREGEKVKKGKLLITADLDLISSSGFNTVTSVVICNSDSFSSLRFFINKKVDISDELAICEGDNR